MAALSQCGQLVSLAGTGVVTFVSSLRGLTLVDRAARPLKRVRETWNAARAVQTVSPLRSGSVPLLLVPVVRKAHPGALCWYEYKRSSLEMDIRGSLPQSSSCSHSVKAFAYTAPRETHERTGNTDRHW